MVYPKIPLAQSIIQICLSKGIRHIVISPGSRNAPLTIGFVNNPAFTCYSIADERCAAFFALGIAQQIHKPVAVICTSGSALLNFYPAFAEAFYSMIPLIVISADRPADKIDIGDGQTIRQRNVFENHSLYNANLSEQASEENDLKINEAIDVAFIKRGPVHINAPFEEPLYETTTKPSVDPIITSTAKVYRNISVDNIIACTNVWNASTKKLILVGGSEPDEIDPKIIFLLATDPSVVVMTEVTSNLHDPAFIDNIDTVITPFDEKDFTAWRPEILITFGGMVVSKRIKSFLRQYKPDHHWHIDPLRAYDTFASNVMHFKCGANDFFSGILPHTAEVQSNYRGMAQKIKLERKSKHDTFLATAPFSDFKVFEYLMKTLPTGIMLQISNSASIRYAQLFGVDPSIAVYCNRGTSGIDGSTSTAIGAASAVQIPTLLITGDVSFLYDSNALWNEYIPKNFKIVLINNGGGGIFRILPGHQENEVFNKFFETSHCLTAEHLAKMYGFDYYIASDQRSLENSAKTFYANDEHPCILEIFTPTLQNNRILSDYFRSLSEPIQN